MTATASPAYFPYLEHRTLAEVYGLEKEPQQAAPVAQIDRAKRRRKAPKRMPYKAAPDHVYVDPSEAGQAAEYLRRFGPVVRCNEGGAYDPAGARWRRGSVVLSAAEIVERARHNGWQGPWKLVA